MAAGLPLMAAGLVAVGVTATAAAVGRRVRPGTPPGALDVLGAFALLLWTASVVSLALAWSAGRALDAPPDLLAAIAGTGSGAVAAAAYVLGRAPRGWLGLRGAPGRWWALAVLLVPAFLALSAGWVAALEALGVAVAPQRLLDLVVGAEQPAAVAVALLYGVVGAPLTEELLFRGLLLGVLRDRLDARLAVLLQGLLFGLIHGADPAAIVPLAALGVALGALRVRSDSLGPAVLAHAANNGVALALAVTGLLN